MNFEEYSKLVEQIRQLRLQYDGKIAIEAARLRDLILAQLSAKTGGIKTVSEMEDIVQEIVRLNVADTSGLRDLLESGAAELAKARRAVLLQAGIDAPALSYEEIMSAYRVNFPSIAADTRRTVIKKFRRIVANGQGVADLTKALRGSGLVRFQAETLSKTALAQFDNDYSITLGEEAGIGHYRYSGPPAQRLFCKEHLGNDYTSSEISRMNNGQGLPVRSSCGGYNCTHQWIANPFKV